MTHSAHSRRLTDSKEWYKYNHQLTNNALTILDYGLVHDRQIYNPGFGCGAVPVQFLKSCQADSLQTIAINS
jgi:hypothetical protein